MLKLVSPSEKYKETFLEGCNEILQNINREGSDAHITNEASVAPASNYDRLEEIQNDFTGYLEALSSNELNKKKKVFWLIDENADGDSKYVGQMYISAIPNFLKNQGLENYDDWKGAYGASLDVAVDTGSILIPSERGKRYSLVARQLLMTEMQKMGIKNFYMETQSHNKSAQSVMNKLTTICGGKKLETESPQCIVNVNPLALEEYIAEVSTSKSGQAEKEESCNMACQRDRIAKIKELKGIDSILQDTSAQRNKNKDIDYSKLTYKGR